MRIRQLVIAAKKLEPHATQIREILDLPEPYRDPGVSFFGLENVVFPVGDQFLEIVAPIEENTAVDRFIARQGEGGYMAIFQTDDLNAVRKNGDEIGIRRVWNADFDDISASHFHPGDTGAAIVSVDEPRPPESWKWAGPGWSDKPKSKRALSYTGAKVSGHDADQTRTKWESLLGKTAVGFAAESDAPSKLTEFFIKTDARDEILAAALAHGLPTTEDSFEIAGLTVRLH